MGVVWRATPMALCFVVSVFVSKAGAQSATGSPAADESSAQHEHMQMNMGQGWQFMQDGIVFAEFNHQGGPRGGNDFVAPNWRMGWVTRATSRGRMIFTS